MGTSQTPSQRKYYYGAVLSSDRGSPIDFIILAILHALGGF